MPSLSRCLRLSVLVLALGLLAAAPAAAQFTRLTDIPPGELDAFHRSAAWVDVDGDGDLDLFAGTFSGPNVLYRNDGGGAFTALEDGPLQGTRFTSANCWGDLNNDGALDVVSASNVYFGDGVPAGGTSLFLGAGDGTFARVNDGPFARPSDNVAFSCAWGDIDNDGAIDLFLPFADGFVARPPGVETIRRPNRLYRGDGAGGLTPVQDSPVVDGLDTYTQGVFADYDQDGDLDLFIGAGPANQGERDTDYLYRNLLQETGTATFERITDLPLNAPRDGQQWSWVDVDNDGDLDGFVTNYSRLPNEFFRNDNGTFVRVTDSPLTATESSSLANVWADFDNDGDLDVFIANEGGFPNEYYENTGAPAYRFEARDDFAEIVTNTYNATAGDYDLDGDLDLYVPTLIRSDFGGTASYFYRNDSGDGRSWVRVLPVGTASNRAGIGAVVEVTAEIDGRATTQLRTVSASNSFYSHNALSAHVGLLDAAVATIRVTWPSGQVDTYADVPAGQPYVAVEGEALEPQTAYLAGVLSDRVAALDEDGTLGAGLAQALTAKLEAARTQLLRFHPTPARGILNAYRQHVLDLQAEGRLPADTDRRLLDPLTTIETLLANEPVTAAPAKTYRAPDRVTATHLGVAAPSPFREAMTVDVVLASSQPVSLVAYDVLGRRVRSIIQADLPRGEHTVTWDGRTDSGRAAAAGLYLLRLVTSDGTFTRKVVRLP